MPRVGTDASTLVELLSLRASDTPEQVAYTYLDFGEDERGHLTYGELDRASRALSARLAEVGTAGERVLLLFPTGLEFIVAFFGSLDAGLIPVPADLPRKRSLATAVAILRHSRASVVLTTSALLVGLRELIAAEYSDQPLMWVAVDLSDPGEPTRTPPRSHAHTPAYIQYTSGSSGTPSGTVITHRNVLHNLAYIDDVQENDHDSISVTWLPHFHDMGLVEGLLLPLYAGHPCYFMSPASFLQHPVRWLQAITRYRATNSGAPNFAYELCVRRVADSHVPDLDLRSWRVAYNGAEPIRPSTIERFQSRFESCGFRRHAWYPVYGLAEATLMVTSGRRSYRPVYLHVSSTALEQRRILPVSSEDPGGRRLVSSGEVNPHVAVAIVHPSRRTECDSDEVGEIWIAGPSISPGYWADTVKTETSFGHTLGGREGLLFHRTGDLGFIRDNNLFITGRLKDQIIIRGRNHYPQDVEVTVQGAHPAVAPDAGAAFSIDLDDEERLVVVQEVERSSRRGNLDDVITEIRRAVADRHQIDCFAVVLIRPTTLPKTSSGKVQRQVCRAAYLCNELQVVAQWVRAEPSQAMHGTVRSLKPVPSAS